MDDEQELVMSIEKLRLQFEQHKLRCEQQRAEHNKLIGHFKLEATMRELNSNMRKLRLDMYELHRLQKDLSCWADADAIEELPSSISNEDVETEQQLEVTNCCSCPVVSSDEALPFPGETRPCLFGNCRRRVDSQLLLLHYASEHSSDVDDACNYLHYHKLRPNQHIVLSFEPQRCELQQQQVIGLLDYTSFNLPACSEQFSTFLRHKLHELVGDVQIVVLICKTCFKLQQVFVIWLVTPQQQPQLIAQLRLCGRDAALQATSTLKVRSVQDYESTTTEMMPMDGEGDADFWKLTYGELQKMSSNWRDELHLDVGIAQL